MATKREGSRRVTITALRNRLSDHVYVSYLNYSFFIKGAVVASAGSAFIGIIRKPDIFMWDRFLLWAASLSFSLVTIATWNRGAAFTSAKATIIDIVTPILAGVIEVAMFVIIDPFTTKLPADYWTYWYLALCGHSLLAIFIIGNRIDLLNDEDFTPSLAEHIKKHKKWLEIDRFGASVVSFGSLCIFLMTRCFGIPTQLCRVPLFSQATVCTHASIALLLTALAIAIVHNATRQYQDLTNL